MAVLVVGILLFIGVHFVPSLPVVRDSLIGKVGFNRYRGLFSLVSLFGFVLIVFGKRAASMVPLWDPPTWSFTASIVVMPLALTLLAGAYLPSNIKRFTRHPMLWGVALWAGAHLLSNGDLASLILFGGFGAFALLDMVSANRRGAELSKKKLPVWRDLTVVVVGLALYLGFLHLHDTLFGPPVLVYAKALFGTT